MLEQELASEAMLRDLDVRLIFPFVHLPRPAMVAPIEELIPDVDDAGIQRLRDRRAYLVIDHSHEGPRHIGEFSELLHAWCALHSVPPSTLIYVSANAAYPRQYALWCDRQGRVERYTHLYFNAYVHEIAGLAAELERTATEALLIHARPRPHRFLSFNYAPRPERLLVVAHMLSASPSDALVSVGSDKGPVTVELALKNISAKYRSGRLLERHSGLFEQLDVEALRAGATLPVAELTGETPLYLRFDLEQYAQTCISVVTETSMNGPHVRCITEKAIKPFLFGHVAVVAGNVGTLAMVRDAGFQTFGPLIDEGYDDIPEPDERHCAVLCEIDRLRALNSDAIRDIFMELEEVRRANLRYGHDVLRYRLAVDAQTAMTQHILDGARVSV